jgi:hypothetical protein
LSSTNARAYRNDNVKRNCDGERGAGSGCRGPGAAGGGNPPGAGRREPTPEGTAETGRREGGG